MKKLAIEQVKQFSARILAYSCNEHRELPPWAKFVHLREARNYHDLNIDYMSGLKSRSFLEGKKSTLNEPVQQENVRWDFFKNNAQIGTIWAKKEILWSDDLPKEKWSRQDRSSSWIQSIRPQVKHCITIVWASSSLQHSTQYSHVIQERERYLKSRLFISFKRS
jgi:hypothetical protein